MGSGTFGSKSQAMKNIFFTLLLLLISILTKAQNAGIGVAAPQEKLDVDGAIRMGTTTNTNAGTIRWNPDRNDFEGYNGDRWVSLTGNAGQWGRQDDYSFEDGATDFILKFVNNDFGEGDKFGYQVRLTSDCAIITSPFSALGHANNNGNVHYYYK